MKRLKKFLRDLFVSAGAFYLPIILLELLYISLGVQDRPWVYLSASAVPVATSLLVFFLVSSKWEEKPSPMVTLLGTWIGGPISFIAGTYVGFLGGLLVLAFFYPIFSMCRLFRPKSSFGLALTVFLVALIAAGLTIYIPASTFNARYPLSKSAYRRQSIRDVTQAETLTLAADPNRQKVYRITVYTEGELDGKATIRLADSKDRIKAKEIGPGKFKERLSGDWHEPVCFLSYEPATVHSGQVTIYYELWGY